MNGGLAIPQSAVLGYRIVGNRAEVLLVTSRTRGRWVLPKGMITAGMTPAESAVKEAWEEAGVAGNVSGGCLGVYRYIKTRRCGVRSCAVKVYAMKVTAVLPQWPEQRLRRRRWMSIDEAICKVMNRDLKRLLVTFRANLRPCAIAFRNANHQAVSDRCRVSCGGFNGNATRVAAWWRAACRAPGEGLWCAGKEQESMPPLPLAAMRKGSAVRADQRRPARHMR